MNENGLSETELAEIRQIGATLEQGWNEGSGALFASPFAEDADYTVWNGLYAKGKAAIATGHDSLFAGYYKNTHQRIELVWARRLTTDIALAQFQAGTIEAEQWPSVKPLLVLHRHAGTWQIAAFQNTPIMPHPMTTETSA